MNGPPRDRAVNDPSGKPSANRPADGNACPVHRTIGIASQTGRSRPGHAALFSVFCFLFSSLCFAQKPPVVERITDRVFRVGAVTVDTAAKTATCSGEINMDAGAVEYLAVAAGGKLHESLLRVEARPLHLQVALLLLGLEPKNVLSAQGEAKIPQGDPVEIWIRWHDANDETKEVRAESLLVSGPKDAPMPDHTWVFTGSRILKEGFEGDIAKSLVAIWYDPAALLDNPLPSGANNVWSVNPKRTPKRGTPIEFIIKALSKPAPKPETKAEVKSAEPPKK